MRYIFLLALCCSNIVSAATTILEEQLKQAIYQNNSGQIQSLLYQYQQQPQQDLILKSYAEAKLSALQQNYDVAIRIYRKILSERPELNSIRMELAKVLFADRQDSAARVQFDKVKSVKNLPSSAYQLIERYIDALNSRNSWQFDASVSYLKTDNVENVSSSSVIENTGFVKGAGMLPQKAQGFAYNLGINRDFNLIGSHYLGLSNETYGKIEYEKRRFFKDNPQAGNIRTASTTLIWYRNPEQIFYLGAAFSQQRLQDRQYSSDIQNLRLGWLQEYAFGISTKLNFSFTHRQFKHQAILGGILPLGKIRQDHIYSVFAQVWKRDWHLWGITPKLNLEWRKQKSNLDTLYSYKMHNVTLAFEKTF
ncbi:surface lipoprotein assembly modifier [Glaesserella parasuis]|uniref:surface lipoprotein assembly modifier n=1 Tax=Glaesserella parasuis TaxID=738 RepID=UPI0021BDD0E8|nr:DUF560 domain-containing protein [Glaesserella parasuis]MCT8780555.1 DUF560 domain-containing protein [Glaesserella parasuis]MCT8818359.1 DUF560 domain-containing protein [Glaesserella parasuis]MDE3934296.1 surface lipoprotein assembly modifier [Glaesserella parasuis]MDE3945892.1 surface lipoprotein assembly modifier [Glaesserella parasuis]